MKCFWKVQISRKFRMFEENLRCAVFSEKLDRNRHFPNLLGYTPNNTLKSRCGIKTIEINPVFYAQRSPENKFGKCL